jgi:glycosyltransferase involved in cell wall biosynthesis
MLLEHRRSLEEAGWGVRVCARVAKHEIPVVEIPVHFRSPRFSSYEYYWRFVRANPHRVLLAYDEPGVAMFAPARTIIRFSWTGSLPRYWRLRWAVNRFRKANYLFPSHAARNAWLGQHDCIPFEHTHVIWNGVDLEVFQPSTRDNDVCRVGFCGQWTFDKGLDVLAGAWDLVHQRLPQAELWLAGGPDLWQRLSPVPVQQLVNIEALGLTADKGVRVWGVVPRSEMPAFWGQVSVACVPSVCEEQFGLVALEAMACGVPIVVSRSGALPEIVGDCGIIVPKGDPMALADALTKLLNSFANRQALGLRARERARVFDRQQRASELVTLVDKVSGVASRR